jgi:tetratricopeptide (TPR) repeat protein
MQYAAFISYSSIDRAIGEKMQEEIESFVVPASLRGKDFGRGPVPKRIAPVFRDRWDAGASADLGETIRAALEASKTLILLCSPAAARSVWVEREIRFFKQAGRDDRVHPVLVAGEPRGFDAARNPQGAFPPALLERWDAVAMSWVADDREPLAPDVRPEGDGLRFAVLKLAAALTGIPLTILTQRQAEAERRERNTARWIAGSMAFLALGAAAGAWTSWRASADARSRLDTAIDIATGRVDEAFRFRDRYGVPGEIVRALMDGAKGDFDALMRNAPATPRLDFQRARMDRVSSQQHAQSGSASQQIARAVRALTDLEGIPLRRRLSEPGTWFAPLPSALEIRVEHISATESKGEGLAMLGEISGARTAFEAMATDADSFLADFPNDPRARILAANARAQLARLDYENNRLDAALGALREAEKILNAGDGNDDLVLELGKIRSEEAEMLFEQGNHDDALTKQQSALDTLEKVSSPAPEHRQVLAATLTRLGDMRWVATRAPRSVLSEYSKARDMLAALQMEDGARTDVKRNLSVAYERLGDALLQAGDRNGARQELAGCLSLRRELLARDPSNQEWRRDLSVALEHMAEIESVENRHGAAQKAFAEALRLREEEHAANPEKDVAVRDLAVLWIRIGAARARASMRLADIEVAYERAIQLLSPMVAKAPPQSRWGRDLFIAHAERGEARRRAGKRREARSDFLLAWAGISRLRAVARDDPQLADDEGWLRGRIRALPDQIGGLRSG